MISRYMMAIHFGFDYSGALLQRIYNDQQENCSSDEDDEERIGGKSKKERLIGHKSNKSGKSNRVEMVGILVGVFFVAATTTFAVYSEYSKDTSGGPTLATSVFSEVKFDQTLGGELYNKPQLPRHFIPIKYILYMYPNLTEMTYTGLVKIRVQCNASTDAVVIHSTSHQIGEISIKTLNVTDIEDILVTGAKRNERRETVTLYLNQQLVKKYFYDFYIGFKGNLSDSAWNGMYVSSTKNANGKTVRTLSTMFMPSLARKVFPCFDEPRLRAEFQLIIQHHNDFVALSNMGIQEKVVVGSNVETHFNTSPPLSTFQFSFVLSEDLQSKQVTTPTGTVIQVSAQKDLINDIDFALSISTKLLAFVEKQLSFNYTNAKLDLVCVPRLLKSTFPSYGIVQMTDAILYDSQDGTIFEQEHVAMEIAEAVAAQWFGGIIGFDWWDKQWLINGLAKYIQRSALSNVFKERDFDSLYYERFYQQPIRLDQSSWSVPLGAAVEEPTLSMEVYSQYLHAAKGSIILGMLSEMTGEKQFLLALNLFLQYGRYTASNVQSFSDVFAFNSPGVDVVDFFHYWTNQAGFPLVKAQDGPEDRQLSVLQDLFNADSDSEWTLWRFLLQVQYSCASSIKSYELLSHNDLFPFPNTCSNDTVPLPSKDWYKANAGGKGFYRVDYSKGDWVQIKTQLDQNHTVFSAMDRANLIDDFYELSKYDYHSISDAITMTSYLKKERNFAPVRAALRQLDYVVAMANNETVKNCVKECIHELIVPIFKHLEAVVNKTIEEKHLFHLLINRIVDKQDALSRSYIRNYDIAFLKWILSSERNQLPNYLRDIIMKVGIKYGTKYEWNDLEDYYLHKAKTDAEKDIMIKTLAEDGRFFNEANRTLSRDDFFKYLSYSCTTDEQSRKIAYMMLNEDDSVIQNPDLMRTFVMNCVWGSISSEVLLQMESQLANVQSQPIVTLYKRVIESIKRNIHFAANQGPQIVKWLEQHRPHCLAG